MIKLRMYCIFLFFITALASAQEQAFRVSIPEELLRPRHGESPRYPIDIVIGGLGQGSVSAAAFSFASSIAEGFLSGQTAHPALASVNSGLRESYISALQNIEPGSYRIGGGREEIDGSVSFLVRFIGREYGITGELYIRYVIRQSETEELSQTGYWMFEELLLEEAKSRDIEQQDYLNRSDFLPYERFF